MSQNKLSDPNAEGLSIVEKAQKTFYSHGTYSSNPPCDGCYDDKGTFCVWPVAVFAQAVVDGARIYPKELKPLIPKAFEAFKPYETREYPSVCTASKYFDGNKDIYFDDNAQIASAYITAYEVTGEKTYLDKGRNIVRFLMTGYDSTGEPGGVRWHVGKTGSNSCTTSESACAALRLAKYVPNEASYYIDFARDCVKWVLHRLQDPEDWLIRDGVEYHDGQGFSVNDMKWTYNQGTTISALAGLYGITHDQWYLKEAEKIIRAVCDPNTTIFDRDTQPEFRYYRDNVYFYQLLAEGFADFLLFCGDDTDPKYAQLAAEQAKRNLVYIHQYLRDPKDGLYFQTFEIFRITPELAQQFDSLTGENRKFEPSEGERAKGKYEKEPVEKRPLIKTLLGQGGAARVFFQSARVVPKLN